MTDEVRQVCADTKSVRQKGTALIRLALLGTFPSGEGFVCASVSKNMHKQISISKTPIVQIGVFLFPYQIHLYFEADGATMRAS
ncbi:MAG: hypothetical protein IIX49_05515 [Oscillospiraceae bacterium]|nr:hypothetical protein [Oscillospiraceae bacterium]